MKRIICCTIAFAALSLPVPAAVLNLVTSLTATGNIGQCNGAGADTCGFFRNQNAQSTGTGVIDSFYRAQQNRTEKGFNSDGPLNYDMVGGNFTHAIRVDEFGLVDINGNACVGCATPYLRFLFDVNEGANVTERYLSIDALQLYVKPNNDITSTTLAQLQTGATKIYDLDGANNNSIYLDYTFNAGSGSGDLFFYVPYAAFAGHATDWLYLYGEYGNTGTVSVGSNGCNASNISSLPNGGCDYGSSAGFEEWARIDNPTAVPEPLYSGLALTGGLIGFAVMARRRLAA